MSGADRLIYFIRYGADGPIKIGSSADPVQRMMALQAGTPTRLILLATAPGSFAEETALHRWFAASRTEGEWFAPVADLVSMVAAVADSGTLPTLPEPAPEPRPAKSGPPPSAGPAVHLLRRWLDEQQLSARQLAADAGLPARSVQEWLAGGAIPRADRAARLQRATGGAVRADAW